MNRWLLRGVRASVKAPTLGEMLGSRANALNFVRLVLAVLVIFGHAFPLGGLDPIIIGPFVHSGFHGYAVDGFFVVSGYLILASGMRTKTLGYLWRRFLRIYPGFVVALVVTAFVIAPFSSLFETGAHWRASSATGFVVGALDLKPSQDSIDHTLFSVPHAGVWNGSLWTLFYEFGAYLLIAGVTAWRPVRKNYVPIACVLAVLFVLAQLFDLPTLITHNSSGFISVFITNSVRLWGFFSIGMAFYALRERIRPRIMWGILALAIFILISSLPEINPSLSLILTLVSLPVAVLFLGACLPIRLGVKNDFSYGIYVYAFPVQQLLAILGIYHWGWIAYSVLSLLFTIPMAVFSWFAIERPAMKLRSLITARSWNDEGVNNANQLDACAAQRGGVW